MVKEQNGFTYNKYSQLDTIEKYIYFNRIFNFLIYLVIEYPSFIDWYKKLFTINGNLENEREILICERNNEIAGIAILKKTKEEQKICTLRVKDKYQRNGIGKLLMEYSFEWLENDKPLITLHKSKQNQFATLFKYYDFKLEQKSWSYYNIFSTELAYNGVLPQKTFLLLDMGKILEEYIKLGYSNLDKIIEKHLDMYIRKKLTIKLIRSGLYNGVYQSYYTSY